MAKKKEQEKRRTIVMLQVDVAVPTVKKLARAARELPDEVLAGMMATRIFEQMTKDQFRELATLYAEKPTS